MNPSFLTDPWSDTDKHYPSDSWNDVGTNLYGCAKQLYLLKKRNRSLKILLSIGGWTYSSNFAAPASSEAGRRRFAETAVQIVKDIGFDGVDIDWEYPQTPQQGHDLVALLQETRKALDAYTARCGGSRLLLTVASPAGAQNYERMPLGAMASVLDFFNLMAYDYAGSWDRAAGHQANLRPSAQCPAATPFSTEAAVRAYVAAGVPAGKIVVGMPLYGRAFESTDGLGCGFSGVGEGSWENGVWDYKALPRPGAEERVDEEAGASYCYDPARRVMVSYDNVEVAGRKVGYIHKHGLGGAMFWELSGDYKDHRSLVATVSTFALFRSR